MSALNVLNVTPQCSTSTMFVILIDKLFQGFETVCNTLAGLWYGQEELRYPVLLILLECCSRK
jgi:hypothetical protein